MKPLYFLYHVPKTGGQSIRDHLDRHLERDRDFLHLGKWDRTRPLDFDDVKAMSDPDRARLRTIGGHPLTRAFREFFPDRAIREVIFLREPASRLVSLHNFQATMAENRGDAARSFEAFLEATPPNSMTSFAAKVLQPPTTGVALLAGVLAELSRVWMVGTVESLDQLGPPLFDAVGIPVSGFSRSNVTGAGIRSHVTLTPDLADELAEANPLDVMLYRAARRLERETLERLGVQTKRSSGRTLGFVP